MESIYTELDLYGSKNECARTDTVFSPYLRSAMVWFPFLLLLCALKVVVHPKSLILIIVNSKLIYTTLVSFITANILICRGNTLYCLDKGGRVITSQQTDCQT